MNEIRTIIRRERASLCADIAGLGAIATLLVFALHHLPVA